MIKDTSLLLNNSTSRKLCHLFCISICVITCNEEKYSEISELLKQVLFYIITYIWGKGHCDVIIIIIYHIGLTVFVIVLHFISVLF